MKILLAVALMLALAGCSKDEQQSVSAPSATVCIADETHDQPRAYEEVRDLAMKGNYQAQRNLAYGYVGGYPFKGQDANPILGCAWYKYIVLSGSEKVDQTDIGNEQVYCGQLSAQEQAAAENQMKTLRGKLCH